MQLYVKSEKVDLVEYTMPNWGHWCSAGYRSKGVAESFSAEDREAVECLEQKGLSFSLVDLSGCPLKTRLRARITGINRTPTLVLDDGSKLKGIEQIRKYFNETWAREIQSVTVK